MIFFDLLNRNYVTYTDRYPDWMEVTLMLSEKTSVLWYTKNLVLHGLCIWRTFFRWRTAFWFPRIWHGEHGNVLHQLTTHKAMARQNWLSKRLSVYSQSIIIGYIMIVKPVLCWPDEILPSKILSCRLL